MFVLLLLRGKSFGERVGPIHGGVVHSIPPPTTQNIADDPFARPPTLNRQG
jgi:hypothetical protein